MANQDPLGRSRYFHNASAFGIAAQIDRPNQQTIPTQAAVSLAPSGGHGSHSVGKLEVPGVFSFSSASVEVGGSFDDVHKTHTTFASSVVEDLKIGTMVSAKRVVSNLTIYYPAVDEDSSEQSTAQTGKSNSKKNSGEKGQAKKTQPKSPVPEPSFSIIGSHFENLRIAGRPVDIELGSATLHDNYDTYSKFDDNYKAGSADDWLIGHHINGANLGSSDHNSTALADIEKWLTEWKRQTDQPDRSFWCSAVEHGKLQPLLQGSGLRNFGGLICVPRFGVIYLAELRIHRSHRHFSMIRVQMRSPGSGTIDGGGTSGGGGSVPPG